MDKHHIIPRYKNGSDTMENIVFVTRTQHVMWHFANWTLWGNKEDFIAYRGLAGTIPGHEISQEIRSMNGMRSKERGLGLFALSESEKKKNSSKGGIKGGERMKDYKWITNGQTNTTSQALIILLRDNLSLLQKLKQVFRVPMEKAPSRISKKKSWIFQIT